MKKTLLLVAVFGLFYNLAYSQNVPQGMKYQAVARNLKGDILANEAISLQISLVSQSPGSPVVYYSETHDAITNQLGLFDLVIGGGKATKGVFKDVPWSTDDIWMQVAIKDKGSAGFTTISNSKLLAVPYAFHAATASELVSPASKHGSNANAMVMASSTTTTSTSGSPATPWMTFGNSGTNSTTSRLGTTDYQDLVVITNNMERLRIYANGNFEVKGVATLDSSLVVKGNVTYNRNFEVKGATTLDSSLLVKGSSLYNGNMEVRGTTTFDSAMLVKGQATYNRNIEVKGTTTLDSNLLVKGASVYNGNTEVKGTTMLDSSVVVKGIQIISNNKASSVPADGALVVSGGVGVGGNLNVAGATTFGSVGVSSYVSAKGLNIVNDSIGYLATFQNNNAGEGDGIKIKLGRSKSSYTIPASSIIDDAQAQQFKDLIRCDYTGNRFTLLGNIVTGDLEETAKVIAGVAVGAGNMIVNVINSSLNLPLSIPDITVPATHLSDPIDVTGPINSSLNLPIVLPALTVPAIEFPKLAVPDITIHTPDPLPNITLPGFTVTNSFQLTPTVPLIGATTVMPTLPPLTIPALDIPRTTLLTGRTVMPKLPQIDLTSIGVPSIDITSLSFWGLDFNLCLNDAAGSSPLNNSNEFIRFADKDDNKVGSIRGQSVSDWAANFLNPVFLIRLRGALLSSKMDKFHAQYHFKNEITTALASYAKIGVEYTSGNGDYAEWLERSDKSEFINPGDIVAVKAGKITKDLKNAEQVMVVSHNPIMLGNTPSEGIGNQGNNIAFIGQVPVKIMGSVVSGDYIIGNSSTPGYGFAKHPNQMSVNDFKNAVGRSWVTDESKDPKMVNTVVGVHNNNYLNIIKELKEKEEATDARLKAIEAKLNITVQNKRQASLTAFRAQ